MMTTDMVVETAITAPRQVLDLVVASKPRLLIVSDAPDRLNNLRIAFSEAEVEIITVTPQGLRFACSNKHDLAVVDVGSVHLINVLKTLRVNKGHSEIPVLVDVSRITDEQVPSGVLPKYRAMPCSPSDLVALARRRLTSITGHWRARKLL